MKSLDSITRNLNKELTLITANLDKNLAQISSQSSALIEDARLQINTVGGHTDQMVLETTKQITTLSSNLNRSLEQLNTLLYSPEFTRLMDNLSKLSGQLADSDMSSTIQKAGILVSNLNRVVVRGQSNLLDTLDSLAEASENLNEFSRQISETPSILLRGN